MKKFDVVLKDLEEKATWSGWDREESTKVIRWLIAQIRHNTLPFTLVPHPLTPDHPADSHEPRN